MNDKHGALYHVLLTYQYGLRTLQALLKAPAWSLRSRRSGAEAVPQGRGRQSHELLRAGVGIQERALGGRGRGGGSDPRASKSP